MSDLKIFTENIEPEALNQINISNATMSAYKDIKLRWNPQIQSKENITNNGICKAIKTVVIYPKRLIK